MINLSELRMLEDAFFRCNLNYYKPSLYKLFERHFNEENDFSEASAIKLKNLAQGNKDLAFNTILLEDIKKIQRELKKTPKQFDEQLWRGMLPKIREEVKKTLGLDFKTRSVFFEDSFPEGLFLFEKKGASSVTIFEGQNNSGIYFLNKRVNSFTPILMIHEQMHSCLSQNKSKDQMYIEWFEEGICQWYSMKIYFELTKNKELIEAYRQRSHIYSKIKDEHNFTKRYFEYMKIMARLFLNGGEKLIGKLLVEYMSGNRNKVNSYLKIEDLKIKNLPEKEIEYFLVDFTYFIEPEKLPPLEYLILRETTKPVRIDEVMTKIAAPKQLIKTAIIALQIKGMIFIKEDKIEMNWRKKDLFDKNMIKPYWPM